MNAIQHVRKVKAAGGMAAVYYCPFCNPRAPFVVRVPKGTHNGRGWGLASSSIARAGVAAHIHEKHSAELESAP